MPPQRNRALRSRYDALLIALYERTDLTLREIATLAGRTDRAVQIRVRALRCLPRNASTCRPGTDVGERRAGPRPPQLNAKATARLAAAFTEVARALASAATARAACELNRAAARAARGTARARNRVLASAMRELSHLAIAIEHASAAQDMLAGHGRRKANANRASRASRARSKAPRPRSRSDAWDLQQRVLREQEARMWQAHQAKAARAMAVDAPPAFDPDLDRRINEIAARYDAGPRPRIRRL